MVDESSWLAAGKEHGCRGWNGFPRFFILADPRDPRNPRLSSLVASAESIIESELRPCFAGMTYGYRP